MSQYIYSITGFIVNKKEYFMENSTLYDIKIRNNENLFQPQCNLSIKGVLFMLTIRFKTIFKFK